MYSFSFVMLCLIWSFMVIYEHIWQSMNIYEWIWVDDMFANCCNTCLSQNCRAGSFQVSVSSICETRTAPTKICQVRRHTKHIKTLLLCISKLMSAEKTCKKWLNHLQKSSNHQTSMEVLSVLSILSILWPSWSCLSSLFRLLNNSRERSNHKQSQVFFCGQYCLLSTVVICYDLFM